MPISIMPGSGQGLDPLIQALVQREQNKAEKERIRIAQEGQALEQAKFDAELGRIKDMNMGASLAAQLFAMNQPLTPEKASGIAPSVLPHVIQGLQGFQQVGGSIRGQELANVGQNIDNIVAGNTAGDKIRISSASARNAETEARVGAATADNRIAQSGATLQDTNIRNAINSQVLNGSDPANGARALSAWIDSGLPWAQAAETVGFTGQTSIPKDLKFVSGAMSGAAANDRARAQMFLPLLVQSHQRIQQLGMGDFDGDGVAETQPIRMNFLTAVQQAAGNGLLDIAINEMQDKEQQALLQANRSIADAYRFSLSGQQSSDAERLAMMLSITETSGDSLETIAQKARLRQTLIDVTAARANGTLTGMEAAQRMMNASLSLGDPNATAAYSSLLNNVMNEQGNVIASPVPGGNSMTDVPGLVDGALR